MVSEAWSWFTRLTAYGYIDLGTDLLSVALAWIALRWLARLQADVTDLRNSETYGQHAKGRQ